MGFAGCPVFRIGHAPTERRMTYASPEGNTPERSGLIGTRAGRNPPAAAYNRMFHGGVAGAVGSWFFGMAAGQRQ